jgi:hypothetical protein
LHVLGLPPAFALSQDQTLRFIRTAARRLPSDETSLVPRTYGVLASWRCVRRRAWSKPRGADPWTMPMDGAEATRRRQRIPSSRDELVKERRSPNSAPPPSGRGRHQVSPSARRGLYAPPRAVSNEFNAPPRPPGKPRPARHNLLTPHNFPTPPVARRWNVRAAPADLPRILVATHDRHALAG